MKAYPIFIALALLACGTENNADEMPKKGEENGSVEKTPEKAAAAEKALTPTKVFAKRLFARVRADKECGAERLGYLRAGSVVWAKHDKPLGRDKCCINGGDECLPRRKRWCDWYELEGGGFVCGTSDVITFTGKKLPQVTARMASREDTLPYEYARVMKRAPLYRKMPTREEMEAIEFPEPEPSGDAGTGALIGEAIAVAAEETKKETNSGAEVTGVEEEEEPITLDSLQGEKDSQVIRWMQKGFYVALDRDFKKAGRRYYRTQESGFIPWNALRPRKGSDFQGFELTNVDLSEALTELSIDAVTPVPSDSEAKESTETQDANDQRPGRGYGFVMRKGVRSYTVSTKGSFKRSTERRDYREGVVFDAVVKVGNKTYYRDRDKPKHFFEDRDLRVASPGDKPEDAGEGKWLDVDLGQQLLTAFIGDKPVYATLVSTGKPLRGWHNKEETEDHATPVGDFYIKSKHLTHTMDGDTAFDGPYSVDDVPFVMYFQLSYALHGAFWHDGFGYPKSHGCINLAPKDANYIFSWVTPKLREGWHMIATPKDEQTFISIHGETR